MALVYVIMGNDYPDCVLADKDAADEYVAYKKDMEKINQRKGRKTPIYWRHYEFKLIHGQHR